MNEYLARFDQETEDTDSRLQRRNRQLAEAWS